MSTLGKRPTRLGSLTETNQAVYEPKQGEWNVSVSAPEPLDQDRLVRELSALPALIAQATTRVATLQASYDLRATAESIAALNKLLFPGKTAGDPLRAAANDTERKLAIERALASDSMLEAITRDLAEARSVAQMYRDQFTAYSLIARLWIKSE